MKQVNLFPDRAATFVVHPTPGIGDATTIQEGLDMLPAAGGSLLVREGTYSIGTTITLPVGKPVSIFGCGESTIVALGANVIAAFTIPAGYTTNTQIVFENFKVTGNEAAGQLVLDYSETNGLAEVHMNLLVVRDIEGTIIVNAANGFQNSSPGQDDVRLHMSQCRIRPVSTNTGFILDNPSVATPRCWMTEVEFIGDSLFAVPLLRTDPLFGRIATDEYFGDLYMDGCEMSVGFGESDFAAFECFNSTIWNNDSTNPTVSFLLFGSFNGFSPGTVRDSGFNRIYFEAEEDGINFFSNHLQTCPIALFGESCVVGDNRFQQQGTWPVAHPFVVQVNNEDQIIRNNKFDISTPPTYVIQVEAPATIDGNDFTDVNNGTNGSIFLDNGDAIVCNNRFEFAPTLGPPLREINGPTIYSSNIDLWWEASGGGIVAPVVPRNNGDTINGTLSFNGSGAVGGTATNSIFVNYRNRLGLTQVKGSFKNTGVNNITVREQYFTVDEGTFTRSTVVTPGTIITLDPFDFTGLGGGITFQVIKYTADLSGTAIAFTVYFGAPNAENRP